MGALDDAIREHLELKRQHGASEEDLKRKEDEALGRGGPAPEPAPAPEAPDEAGAVEPTDEELETFDVAENGVGPGAPAVPEPDELDVELRAAELAPAIPEPEAIDPDEVLPEEALELDAPALAEPPPTDDVRADRSADDLGPGEGSLDEGDLSEDVLEETPEFLEDAPGQDSLWFEQRPPKDFDFDD